MTPLLEVQEALSQFIINAAKEKAPISAIQALPEAVRALIELERVTRLQR